MRGVPAQCARCVHRAPGDCLDREKGEVFSPWLAFVEMGHRCPRRLTRLQALAPARFRSWMLRARARMLRADVYPTD